MASPVTRYLIASLLLCVPAVTLGVTPATDSRQVTRQANDCARCGTIEAISQRILPAGINGYFTYDIHVRMDQTNLLRVVPAATRGSLDVGDRVQLLGGVIRPLPLDNGQAAPET